MHTLLMISGIFFGLFALLAIVMSVVKAVEETDIQRPEYSGRQRLWIIFSNAWQYLFIVPLIFLWTATDIISAISDSIRRAIFGPRLEAKLLRDMEQLAAKEGKNVHDWTPVCDGVSWKWDEPSGKWVVKPPNANLNVHCSGTRLPEGTMWNREHYTDTTGVIHMKMWLTDSGGEKVNLPLTPEEKKYLFDMDRYDG